MNGPTFSQGVVVALTLSLVGSVLFVSLGPVASPIPSLKGIIALVALCYTLYLLGRCRARTGRATVAVSWFVVTAACWFGNLDLSSFVLVHIGMIWAVRALFYHSSPVTALVDLALSGLSFAASVWAMVATESLFLSLWCFFLVQALFVAIPPSLKPLQAKNHQLDQQFQSAYRNAEAALDKLSSAKSSVRS